VVEQLAKEYEGRVRVLGANIDDTGETAAALGIYGLPTVLLYKGGKEVGRLVGPARKEKLVDEIRKKIGI
jgi:thioredoxin 1